MPDVPRPTPPQPGIYHREAVEVMTSAVWPEGKWSAEAEVMLAALVEFLTERVDEINGAQLRRDGLWIHTQRDVREWLGHLDPSA